MHQHWHFTTMGGGGGGVNRERERKKDTVRLTDAETLPKVQVKDILMGSATPIRNSDLYIGGSTRTHLFCWFFLILTRLFLGCRKDTEYFSERCSHLSLSFSRLPHLFSGTTPPQVSTVRGQRTKPGCVVRERVSGKVATGKESRRCPWNYRPSEWGKSRLEQKMGKAQWQQWKGAQRESALTDCSVCSLLRSPVGGGPAHLRWNRLPAFLSSSGMPTQCQLGLWNSLVGEWHCLLGTHCIHKTSVASMTTKIFWC